MSLVAAVRSGVLGRSLLILAAVGAILLGLLSMHTMTTTTSEHSMPSAAMIGGSEAHPADAMTMHATVAGDHDQVADVMVASTQQLNAPVLPDPSEATVTCGGMCTPGHAMTAMACVLALLVTSALFALTRVTRYWKITPADHFTQWLTVPLGSRLSIAPPSLLALSISRR